MSLEVGFCIEITDNVRSHFILIQGTVLFNLHGCSFVNQSGSMVFSMLHLFTHLLPTVVGLHL